MDDFDFDEFDKEAVRLSVVGDANVLPSCLLFLLMDTWQPQ